MPKDTYLTVAIGRLYGTVDRLLDGKILVVASEYLCRAGLVHAKTDEILNEIQEAVPLKHPHEEGVVIDEVFGLFLSVLSLPLHEAIFLASNGTSLGNRHVTHYAEYVIDEQRRDFLDVITNLTICSRSVCFLTGRRFELHKDQWQTVYENHNVRSLLGFLHVGPLVDGLEGVSIRMDKVNEVHDVVHYLALMNIAHFNAVLEIIHKLLVLLDQSA